MSDVPRDFNALDAGPIMPVSVARRYEREARLTLLLGDCREVMAQMPEASVDAVVTDPPYGLEFMGKEWDRLGATHEHSDDGEGPWGRTERVRYGASAASAQGWHETWAREALRVLKPGGHLLAFGGPRTYHRLTCAIEDAGFEIRDCLMWLFGSGFPKSLDVSKAIASQLGAVCDLETGFDPSAEWDGFGTALKPAYEPIVLARKPLSGTVAANVQRYGTGALNIDGTRIKGSPPKVSGQGIRSDSWRFLEGRDDTESRSITFDQPPGRWPANVMLDPEAARLLDAQSGTTSYTGTNTGMPNVVFGEYAGLAGERIGFGDRGGASRFFYCAKASRAEREFGLAALEAKSPGELTGRKDGDKGTQHPRAGAGREQSQDVKLDAWVKEVLEATLQADTVRFLRKVTEGFITEDGSEWSTMLSGSLPTGSFLKAGKSTIQTETSSTIDSPISGSLMPLHISAFILDALNRMEFGLSDAAFAAVLSRLSNRIGISVKDGSFTVAAADAISEKLWSLSKEGDVPSRVIKAQRRNDHPT